MTCASPDAGHAEHRRRHRDARPARRRQPEPPDRRRPAVRRSARPPHGGVDAALDRHRRSRAGRRPRPDRRGAPLRRGARHQVRDVRRTARPRRDDRRAAHATPGRAAFAASAASSKPRAKRCAASSATSRRWPISPPRVGSDEKRLSRTIVRINTIESTSPLATGEHVDESTLPAALVPSEPERPTPRTRSSKRATACAPRSQSLPRREQKVIGLYYYGEVTMKQIGAEIGVNESRVSQLHARAIRRLREALGEMGRSRSPRCAGARRVRGEAGDGEGRVASANAAPRRRAAVQAAASRAARRDAQPSRPRRVRSRAPESRRPLTR